MIAGDLEGIDRFTCSLCWAAFGSPVALLEHEAQEDDRLYDLDYEPSMNAETR